MILSLIVNSLKLASTKIINPRFLRTTLAYSFSSTLNANDQQTFNLIMKKLKQQANKFNQMNQALIESALKDKEANPNNDKLRRQLNKLQPIANLYQELSAIVTNIKDIQQMIKQTKDPEEQKLLKEELTNLQQKKQQLREESLDFLIQPDFYDDVNEISLQFRPGVGGTQSAIFVQDLSGMYINYCQGQGWRVSTTHAIRQTAASKGYKQLILKVQGQDVYKIMKCESGVHKVIRVPETDAKGRIHSSTISLAVMPSVPFDFTVNDKDIRYQYMRSSGPGGQSVQKTQSACRAVHIPSGMAVFIQQDRSQDRNRKRATQILKQRLFEIQYKKVIQAETQKRKIQIGTSDRSEKIRTYNYPQDRITDHRTGLTLFGMDEMIGGNYLDQFIRAYMNKIYQQKLQILLEQLSKQQE